MLFLACMAAVGMVAGFESVIEWDFSEEAAADQWRANAHLTDVMVEDGALHARAIDWDPFFVCSDLALAASPAHCVLVRLKADQPGNGQVYWTGTDAGPHGGFSAEKVANFTIDKTNAFHDIYVFPFWQAEGTIRQLRLDVYDEARFAIERIAVLKRHDEPTPATQQQWALSEDFDATGWLSLHNGRLLASPPLSMPLTEAGWVSITAHAQNEAVVLMEWATDRMPGGRRETVHLRSTRAPRQYHIEMQGHPDWEGRLVGLNLYLPDGEHVRVDHVTVAAEPAGPPALEIPYFGFDNGVSRAGRPETLLAQIINQGGGRASVADMTLETADGVRVLDAAEYTGDTNLEHGDYLEVRWQVEADTAGTFPAAIHLDGLEDDTHTELTFLPALSYSADYVPEPEPIETTVDICAYYFPGWDADAKYDCLRQTAPIRKPLLGYYDESNPECVDWQIKWAVENGITCFLVDWYWVDGSQSLLHWFEAYREARYRDYLQVAIMWANHNPPGTHSREDWRQVTQEWIDKYFTLDTYYHINGKPAIFLWDSAQLRADLGGSEEVAAALAESQEMARDAGHAGIEFIVLQNHAGEEDIAKWLQEGYAGNTSYHEFGNALQLAPTPAQGSFADVVATAPQVWEERRKRSGELDFYPVVDTGWDSRPWHGANAMAFHGRTVAGFKQLLEAARDYFARHDENVLILGPINEWGEGSYIEPNLEFGFGMYEAIREVFGKGDPENWPKNLSPRDVGLGPYDFPAPPRTLSWTFEADAEGWAPLMNITDFSVADGVMRFNSTSHDPALVVSTHGLNASEYPIMELRMKVVGPLPDDTEGQVFWAIGSGSISEATSYRFPLETHGEWHTYRINLGEHPRWRGRINMIRFDPCETTDTRIYMDSAAFLKE